MYGDIHLFAEEIDFRSRTIRDTRASSRKKSPPDDGAKDRHAWGYTRVTQSRPHPSRSRATTSKLGRGITLSGMTRFAQIAVVPSPGPLAVRTHGGSGRFAIRALPDLCLGIVSGRLEFAL